MTLNHIICGESAQVLSKYKSECIDLLVTDPSYLVRNKDRFGRTIANDDSPEAVLSLFDQLYRVLKPNNYCTSFYGWNAIAEFSEAWKKAGFKTVGQIFWMKSYASRKGHTRY
ncbi:MAG: hypothetical protein AAGI66_06540 [Cyanobacteria bacterium P01_H01_bin.74]